jgi:glutamate 5-kinase
MISKLEAVRMAVDAGITTVIMNGGHPDRVGAVIAGETVGTRFLPRTKSSRAGQKARRS